MKRIMTAITAAMMLPVIGHGQGYISYDLAPQSTLRDEQGGRFGHGDMRTVRAGYGLPLSVRRDSTGRVTAWTAGVSAAYVRLGNSGEARQLNPDDIVNGSISISHTRPLSRRWDVIASAGCGVYAPSGGIRMNSVLANGVLIFAYRLSDNMSIGVGGGLTNSYGVPMLLPMMYFRWETRGRYELKVDMTNSMRVSAATRIGRRLRVELVAVEMTGMTAVMERDGRSEIYSTVTIGSYIRPELLIDRKTSIYAGFGGNWLRGIDTKTRSLKGLFCAFNDGNEAKHFNVSLRLEAGIRNAIFVLIKTSSKEGVSN